MKYRLVILIFSSIVSTLLLSSCSPWVVDNQSSRDQWMTLEAGSSIGQTFVGDYSGLQAIYFLIQPNLQGNGSLTMHLRTSPSQSIDLVSVSLPIDEITSEKQYRFDFPYIARSNNQDFYAVLAIEGSGSVGVGVGPANTYQNGSAYLNSQPIEAQLSFQLDYDRFSVLLGILKELAYWLGYTIIGLLLFTIPGWAILGQFWKGWKTLTGFEKIALAIGCSLSFYALFVLFTFILHLQLGKWYAWLPVIGGMIIIFWQNRSSIRSLIKPGYGGIKSIYQDKQAFWANLSLIIILGFIFISRYWATRGLIVPMWNDSIHHTEITQLIIDHNGLFSSWMPYAAYQTFSMHFGFPLSAALFSWIIGVGSSQAVLIIGQILGIFAPLALYPITVRLTRGNRIAGLLAVLVGGLLSPMPAYYINWGRYAQLAGQVILPAVMWMMIDISDEISASSDEKISRLPWLKIIVSGGLIAGMMLFEFRMVFVVVTFSAALMVARFCILTHRKWHAWLQEILAVGSIGLISVILFLPWALRLQGSKLITYAGLSLNDQSLKTLITTDYHSWLDIRFYVPIGLVVLALAGLVWGIIKKDWLTASLGLWVGLMASLYALTIFHIPWVQYVQSFAVLISLYIPVGILVGYLGGNLVELIPEWSPARIAVFIGLIALGVLGLWSQRSIANPNQYAFVTQADMQAMQWIGQNTPQGSKFLIEGMHENWVTNVIGTDAGWWIPLMAKRENTIPPQYALSNEQPIKSDYSKSIVDLQSWLEKNRLSSPEGIQLLCDYGITHVYIGQKQGSVGSQATPLFTPEELSGNPVYQLIYHNARVYIYLVNDACNQ